MTDIKRFIPFRRRSRDSFLYGISIVHSSRPGYIFQYSLTGGLSKTIQMNPDTNQPDAEPGTSAKNPDTNQSGTSSKEPQTSDEESSKAISGKKAENTTNGENSTSADKDSVATGDKTNFVSSVLLFSLSLAAVFICLRKRKHN